MNQEWRDAILAGDETNIMRLLAAGTDIDAKDRYGQTALMLAAMHGRDGVVGILLAQGVDLDVTAKFGLSALMLAVINRHADSARRLVDAGANLSLTGSGAPGFAGKTALDLAEHGGLSELVAYIAAAQ